MMPAHRPDTERSSGRERGSLAGYLVLALVLSLPVFTLAAFAWYISTRALDQMVSAGNEAGALLAAGVMEREASHWLGQISDLASSPVLVTAASDGDPELARRRLGGFVDAHAHILRAFLADREGLLWADFPPAPESLGRSFAFRDWFTGVSAADAPYISEVYQRAAPPQLLVVALAAPVRDPMDGSTLGYVVAQVALNGLSGLFSRVTVGSDGEVFVLDHRGTLAAHPSLDVSSTIYRQFARVPRMLPPTGRNAIGRGRYSCPLTGEEMLASAASVQVGSHGWTVVAQQPVASAFAPNRQLTAQLLTAGLLLAVLMGLCGWRLARENTRRERAEQDLLALNRELERRIEARTAELRRKEAELLQVRKLEAVGRLAGGIAHDFNNLLTVILGSLEMLADRLGSDEPARRETEVCQQAAERAARLTQQLLAFSRRQVMQPQLLDLNLLLGEMRELLDRLLGERIQQSWKLQQGLHPVRFDPAQLEQVVMNLALNARDAMPDGGMLCIATANVELPAEGGSGPDAVRAGPYVELLISDTGTGMDEATQERIFEPFYTTKEFGRGTGLGLATVYGIVRQGGGHIRVESAPGQGTRFRVYLPASL